MMISRRIPDRLATMVLIVGFLAVCGVAGALDLSDVRTLVTSQVPESVILNMVAQSSPIPLTAADANQLRAMGASESLVSAIAAKGYAPAPAQAPAASQPGEYVLSDGSTSSYPTGPVQHPGMVTQQPNTVYLPPATTSGAVSVDPNIYYEIAPGVLSTTPPSGPTVVYQSPTVIETAPTYIVPGYPVYRERRPSFSFSIGGGRGGRGGRWGGGPRYHPGRRGPWYY